MNDNDDAEIETTLAVIDSFAARDRFKLVRDRLILIFSGYLGWKYYIDVIENKLIPYENDKTFYGLNNGIVVYDEINAKAFFFNEFDKDRNQVIKLYDILPPCYYYDVLVDGYCNENDGDIAVSIIDIIVQYFAKGSMTCN